MRSSAQRLSRETGRSLPVRGRSEKAASNRPVQLELFGGIRAVQAPAFPVPTPSDPNALRFHLLRQLNRLTGGRLRSLELTDNQRTILSVRAGRVANRAPLELRIHEIGPLQVCTNKLCSL